MYCDLCGKQNKEDAKYCFYCGAPLNSPSEKKMVKREGSKSTPSANTLAGAKKNPSDFTKKEGAEPPKRRQSGKPERKQDVKSEHRRSKPMTEEELTALEKELDSLKKSDRQPVAVIAAVAAIAVFILLTAYLGTKITRVYSPQQKATDFETAWLSGNWDAAYSLLDLPENSSGLLSADCFRAVMEQTGASGFRELQLAEAAEAMNESETADLQDPDRRVYRSGYMTADGPQQSSVYLHSIGKKYLICKDWKVDPKTVSVANVTIVVPAEAHLLLNGYPVEAAPEVNEALGTASYSFDSIFAGNWKVELQEENRAPYQTTAAITKEQENGMVSLANVELYPDQALSDKILQQFTQDYQAILEASVNRQDFSTVQGYFAEQAIQEGRAANMYNNACSQAYDPERGVGILKYELSDIRAEFVPIGKSGYAKTGDLVMEVHSVLSFTYMEDGIEKSSSSSSVGLLCYHQENGQWKIQSFN